MNGRRVDASPTDGSEANQAAPSNGRVAAALAELAAAADSLRELHLEGIEPAFVFDAAWDSEAPQ